MATADEYASWIVKNADKRGTPDFQTVAEAYQLAKGQPTKTGPATFAQKVQASGPMRLVQGMRDSIDAGAQMLAHAVPESVTNVLDIPGNALRDSNSPFLQTVGETFFANPRASAIDRSIRGTEKQYQDARIATGQTGADAMRFAGNVVSPTNAAMASLLSAKALATVPRMIGTGAATGAAGAALTPIADEQGQQNFASTKAAQTGLGAVTGAVLTPVMGKVLQSAAPYVERLIGKITGSSEAARARASLDTHNIMTQALKDLGQTIDDIPKPQYDALRKQINDALKKGQKLDAAALMRKSDFDALGMPSTAGQITRDPTQFARERNLRGVAGVGEPLMQRFDAQNQALQTQIGGFAKGATDTVTAGERMAAALADMDKSMQSQVSSAYKVAKASAGKDLDVPLQGLASDAGRILDDFGDKVPGAIVAKLRSFGMLGEKQTKVFTFDEANKLLTNINDHVGIDRTANTALGQLRQAVKTAMMDSPAPDVFANARKAAATRFQMQDAIPALKAASEGSVPADSFVRKFVLNGPSAEVKRMADLLQKTSPEAFQEARSQVGSTIQRAAFGENLAGDKLLTPENMARVLREMGPQRLGAFFSQTEIDQMNRLARVGAYINSNPSAAAVSSSSSNIASMALNYGAKIPDVGPFAAMAKAVISPIANQRAVSQAMASQVPSAANVSPVSPEMIKRAQLAAALMGIGAGQSVGQTFR